MLRRCLLAIAIVFVSISQLFAISLGPIGGTYDAQPGAAYLEITSLDGSGPGTTAGLQVGDYLYSAFGEQFTPIASSINEGWKGSVQQFGAAIERAEAGNGILPLTVLRPGVGEITINVQLAAVGSFGPAYPLGSPKFDALYEEACAQIHAQTSASSNGNFGYNTGYFGLTLLAHPNWNSTTGSKPYRLSINKLRDHCMEYINSRIVAPVEEFNNDGTPNDGSAEDSNPSDQSFVSPGLENWELTTAAMFLAEYKRKTGDTSVDATCEVAIDCLENRIQDYAQPPFPSGNNPGGQVRVGMMGHGGVTGDYPHINYIGLNIINAHTLPAFALLSGAGYQVDAQKFDDCWENMKGATLSNGGSDDGNVGYAHYSQNSGYDSAGRTAGAIFGMLNNGGVSVEDQAVVDRQKDYIVRHWQRMQHAHAYTLGGTSLYQFALPYLDDREQRYIMENQVYFYHAHRSANGGITYFGGRSNNGGDTYLNTTRVALLNIGLAKAIQSGNLPSFPAVNANRIHAAFKRPHLTWPQLEARAVKILSSSQEFTTDITDYLGNVLNAGDYTAAWSLVSGPGTVNFSNASQATTTATFSSPGNYRIQLTVSRNGYVLTEPIDVSVLSQPIPDGYKTGSAESLYFSDIAGTAVSSLTDATKYPDDYNQLKQVSSLEVTYTGDNYGTLTRGYIIPQVTGQYEFYVTSDDSSEFHFGPDENTLSKICENASVTGSENWTQLASQKSAPQSLTAGVAYYFEYLQKEAGGADYGKVAWTGPGFSTPTVIPGDYLALRTDDTAQIVSQPTAVEVAAGGNASFNVRVSGSGPFLFKWFLDGISYWPASESSTLDLTNLGAGYAGFYRCEITTPAGTITSDPAELTVTGLGQTVAGGLWREVYEDIGGGSIDNLVNDPKYPRFSDSGDVITTTRDEVNTVGRYGQRWTGWLVPDTSGDHRFFIASDDSSELWLSTDDSPQNKVRIASINGYRSEGAWTSGDSSAFVSLQAGNRYYIEIRHKEGGGASHCGVAWQKPGESQPANGTGYIPSGNLEYRTGGIHEQTVIIDLTLTSPSVDNVQLRPGVGLALSVAANPQPNPNDLISWSTTSGPTDAVFEHPNQLSTGARFPVQGTYKLQCQVDNGGQLAIAEVTVVVTDEVQAQWTSSSVAEPTTGSASIDSSGVVTISGSGSDIYRRSDEHHFFHQTLTGDFDVRARLSSKSIQSGFGTHTALMARETLSADARNVAITHEVDQRVAFQYREVAGGNTTYRQIPNISIPVWIRLVRSGGNPSTGVAGQTFTGYYSLDNGQTWIQRETMNYSTAMPDSLMVGFAISSGGSSLNTAIFDNISGFPRDKNFGPVVDAGSNQSLNQPGAIQLDGSATDDGSPSTPGNVQVNWTRISGPDAVTFDDATTTNPTANFGGGGDYILRLSATDGLITTYDDVSIGVIEVETVSIAATDDQASEGSDNGTFTISRVGSAVSDLTVNLTIGGTATNGSDYQTISETIVIPAGSSSVIISVIPIADGILENTEDIQISVASGNYTLGSPSSASVSIGDDPDSDGDGLPDQWELDNFGNLGQDGTGDADSDGISDAEEYNLGTDPNSSDSDNDSYPDSLENKVGTDPTDENSKPTPATNLVHHYKLNESSGTIVADAVASSPQNGTTNGSGWDHFAGSGHLNLDGTDDRITLPSAASLIGPTDFSVALWFKSTSSTNGYLYSQRDSTGSGFQGEIVLTKNANGSIRFFVYNSGFQFDVTTPTGFNDGSWHHVIATRDGLTGKIYIDGVQQATATGSSIANLRQLVCFIGVDGRDNRAYLDGSIDDVRVYDRAMVSADYDALNTNLAPVIADTTINLPENTAILTNVHTFAIQDGNSGDQHHLNITAGDDGLFNIANSNLLGLIQTLDYETSTSHQVTVGVRDNGTPSRTGTATITINVSDVIQGDDSDGDNLNDNWEMTHYGNGSQSANSDSDGDGMTAFDEMVTGSDPNSKTTPNEHTRMVTVDVDGSPMTEFRFRRPSNFGDYGIGYQLLRSFDLGANSWIEEGSLTPTIIPDGANEWLSFRIPANRPGEAKHFYRFRAEQN